MQDQTKLALRAKPIQPVQINRPVVFAIFAIVALAILLAIIYAFNVPEVAKIPSSAIKAITDKPVAMSSELNGLPSDYSDVNTIKKYLGDSSSEEIAKLQRQLDSLKSAYELLEEQMRANNDATHDSRRPSSNPQDDQAKLGSMTFPGLSSKDSENLIGSGPGADRGGRTSLGQQDINKPADLVATKQQAEFYEKEGENKQRLSVISAPVDSAKIAKVYERDGGFFKPISKYQIQGGTIIQASLITGINTSSAGTIVAQVRQSIYDTVTGKHLLIPKGSKLLGEYDSRHVSYGQRRIAMWYTRVVLPNGNSILLGRPLGADVLGQGGVEGNVDNHWAKIIGAAAISTILSVGTSMWADKGVDAKNNQLTDGQKVASGMSSAVSGVGGQLTSRAMSIPPTITVPPGYPFTVVVNKDLVLEPFKHRQ